MREVPENGGPTARGKPSKVNSVTGAKSYQGSRRGTCGWITSFLERRVCPCRKARDRKAPEFVARTPQARPALIVTRRHDAKLHDSWNVASCNVQPAL